MPQRIYTTCDKIEDFQKVLKIKQTFKPKTTAGFHLTTPLLR